MSFKGLQIRNIEDIDNLMNRLYPEDILDREQFFYQESREVLSELIKYLWRKYEKNAYENLRNGGKK